MKIIGSGAAAASLAALLVASAAGAQTPLPGERPAVVAAIPGVVAADAHWELVHAGFSAADGLVGTPDGGLLYAEEQTDSVRKLDVNGREQIVMTDAHGVGAVSLDAKGRLYAVQRTCTDPGKPFSKSCSELTMVSMLSPEHRLLANSFKDGRPLGRLNDLIADGKGGAYFTVAGVFYVNAAGEISTVADAQAIRPNGIALSPDGRTLYVTNDAVVVAFDVRADGSTANRRDFGRLDGDMGGDGMAVDSAGRLYVTAAMGVHVLAPDGRHLGMIPTPRRAISIAFSGADRKALFISELGAVGPDGKDWKTPEGVRNTATTIHKLIMLAQGPTDRPK